MASTKRVSALKLSLGNAPHTYHIVPGVSGLFHPDHATPLGGEGERSVGDARDLLKEQPGLPLEIVQITEAEAERRREELKDVREVSRQATLEARRNAASAEEADRIHDEAGALSNGKED